MVLGSIFTFLNPLARKANQSTTSFNREVFGVPRGVREKLLEDGSPRALIALADVKAINRQRQQLATNFGFEDTISRPENNFPSQQVNTETSTNQNRSRPNRRTIIGR